ncbi:DEAD/DEAH box helicase [Photobacterium swingsii]|uniref:DEAD/DEAH box helicase n=1 Tax=Photobacterium swingsii TaxID=680026 RepID=UPI00354D73F9
MLRVWQSQCIETAIKKYTCGESHFLAQATPGAGKTIMAANLAKWLLDADLIDIVLCFSPSKVVAIDIARTFSRVTNCSFNGNIGSIGCSMTYQSLAYLGKQFWDTLSKYRVFCVFDEIHHCAGDSELNVNSWGYHVLYDVQQAATYTLALTGTPWRSDLNPVALASYSDPEGKIICDYRYSLSDAVRDGVCRKPKVAIVDGQCLGERAYKGEQLYGSITALVSSDSFSYSSVLKSQTALAFIIEKAVCRLDRIRISNPHAGGLIVASSVAHAQLIARMLITDFKQSLVVVTYKEEAPLERINEFKTNNIQWIVSVGMVSEGTDIPRLQVCCHLSNVKTELYFRQILGRILRSTLEPNQEAWLYTFAEPKLIEFAEQIEKDIPDSCLYLREDTVSEKTNGMIEVKDDSLPPSTIGKKASIRFDELVWEEKVSDVNEGTQHSTDSDTVKLDHFKQRVIEAFQYLR